MNAVAPTFDEPEDVSLEKLESILNLCVGLRVSPAGLFAYWEAKKEVEDAKEAGIYDGLESYTSMMDQSAFEDAHDAAMGLREEIHHWLTRMGHLPK